MAGANAKNEAPYYDADVTSYGKRYFYSLFVIHSIQMENLI